MPRPKKPAAERLTHCITAMSLRELPPAAEIRAAVDRYIFAKDPSAIVKDHMSVLKAGQVPGQTLEPVHEADRFLDPKEYRKRVYRKNYYATHAHHTKLAQLAYVTRLPQTSIIRLALAEADKPKEQPALPLLQRMEE